MATEYIRLEHRTAPRANRAAYRALLARAAETRRPTAYAEDLTIHDDEALARLPEGQPFAWLLRESGTWLLVPGAPCAPHILGYALKYESQEGFHLAHWWDGERLTAIPLDAVPARLSAAERLEAIA